MEASHCGDDFFLSFYHETGSELHFPEGGGANKKNLRLIEHTRFVHFEQVYQE